MSALFIAFSIITVPAYVAMFGSNEEMDMDDEDESRDTPAAIPSANLQSEEWDASPIHRATPISGLFQRARLRRLM